MNRIFVFIFSAVISCLFGSGCVLKPTDKAYLTLKKGFLNPPDSVRPGVYWYFMDGNLSREGMTKDLESMKEAGIGNVLFLEVNVGVPRGKVDFLSEEWQSLFVHAVRECERLGITMTLGVGPGWSGSGGPWVPGELSMQHLVSSVAEVNGGKMINMQLPLPQPKKPYFGEGVFTPGLKEKWNSFYHDVAVLAVPAEEKTATIAEIDDKALYYRAPYTSVKGVKPWMETGESLNNPDNGQGIKKSGILDITSSLKPDGVIEWKAPSGKWRIMRFGVRNNGAVTRPAPTPGLGFEADKMDTAAMAFHLGKFTGLLLEKTGIPNPRDKGGLKMLHMDSWEMGAQNWTPKFREEFLKRRGYDLLPWLPVFGGLIVENNELSERFLWDIRQTAQELVIENHALFLKDYAHKRNMGLSIEPYDMNPTADMGLGSVADVAMCEFWSEGYGFNSSFSCLQAASIAHVSGIKVVAAEAFTAHRDAWKQYPGSVKNQGDWAFAAGINRFVYHTFQHQLPNDDIKPGITMGPYGIHWDRGQTWWPMASGYHNYISKCQFMLQQGKTVADILYLTAEGAPHVFKAPPSALAGSDFLPDRKGYNFDGCSPGQLMKAKTKDGKIVFPGGSSYHILVLPLTRTMTPGLLAKIELLLSEGAFVVGIPPRESPGLQNYPGCDSLVSSLSKRMWGKWEVPEKESIKSYRLGKIAWGGRLSVRDSASLFPGYQAVAALLEQKNLAPDFSAENEIRYTHRTVDSVEIYYVSNRTDKKLSANCRFRARGLQPELWNPLTTEIRNLPEYSVNKNMTEIPLDFEPYESYFIVFRNSAKLKNTLKKNFPGWVKVAELNKKWNVSFDAKWGGPENLACDSLFDWSESTIEGVKYYSGTATYTKTFDFDRKAHKGKEIWLETGEVYNLAKVRVNGCEAGILWTNPWRINVGKYLKNGKNKLEIEVANLWPNRLIGDEQKPYDGVENGRWPEWLTGNKPRVSGRYTFTTGRFYKADSPLLKSGLLGPVRLVIKDN